MFSTKKLNTFVLDIFHILIEISKNLKLSIYCTFSAGRLFSCNLLHHNNVLERKLFQQNSKIIVCIETRNQLGLMMLKSENLQ